MRIIDAHVHVGDNYKPLTPFRDTGRVDRLLRLMDECEVEKAVMVPVVAEFSPDNNSECARWSRQHPDRLAAMTNVAMHELSAIEEVARAREEYVAGGIFRGDRGGKRSGGAVRWEGPRWRPDELRPRGIKIPCAPPPRRSPY